MRITLKLSPRPIGIRFTVFVTPCRCIYLWGAFIFRKEAYSGY
nr:MAG TPA: hypothetical protein [Caudoviricetes sp.]